MDETMRAQSETVGVLLLTGVFVILVSVVAVFALSTVSSEVDGDTLVDVEVNATAQNVSVHHAGGQSSRAEAIEIVVEGDSQERYDLTAFDQRVGDDATRFQSGDVWRGPNEVTGDRLAVSVIDRDANEIVDTETVTVEVT